MDKKIDLFLHVYLIVGSLNIPVYLLIGTDILFSIMLENMFIYTIFYSIVGIAAIMDIKDVYDNKLK